jgi:tetratricopeptide (TPR) repeat protein
MRYSMYGPWLIVAAFCGAAVSRNCSWPRRLAYAGSWAALGVLLAASATGPRWIAEYHWARFESAENSNRIAEAEAALGQVVRAMPQMAHTSRYWLAAGRLAYRQQRSNPFVDYFFAHQYLQNGELSRARAEIEHSLRETGGSTAQRVLLAEIMGHMATEYAARGKYGAAELVWGEASGVVPWKPAYWIGQAVTILAADPQRAAEVRQMLLPRLNQIGDCFVSCDFASLLGDAYFENGEFVDAREMYSEAMDLFNLPKYVNLHAQEGRLGM